MTRQINDGEGTVEAARASADHDCTVPAMDIHEGTQAGLIEKISRWRPDIEASTEIDAIAATAARDAMVQASPRSDRDVKAIGTLYRFFVWCSLRGVTPTRDSLTFARIDEYIEDALGTSPEGTKVATQSRLRCCVPGSSFAGRASLRATSPKPVLTESQETTSPETADVVREELSVPMRQLIDQWSPGWNRRPEWGAIQSLVRAAAREALPTEAPVVEVWLRELSKLGAWLVFNGFQLQTVDALLDENRSGLYLTALRAAEVPEGTLATYRSTFNTVRERRAMIKPPQLTGVPLRRDDLDGGYTPAQLEYLVEMCASARSKAHRRHLMSLYLLALFGGLSGGAEAGCVMPKDITRTGNGVGQIEVWAASPVHRLTVPRRFVTIRDEYLTDRLMTLAAEAATAGDRFIIGGKEDASNRPRRSSELTGSTKSWSLPLDLRKLRTTGLRYRLERVLPEVESLVRLLGASNAEEFVTLMKLAAELTISVGRPEAGI